MAHGAVGTRSSIWMNPARSSFYFSAFRRRDAKLARMVGNREAISRTLASGAREYYNRIQLESDHNYI